MIKPPSTIDASLTALLYSLQYMCITFVEISSIKTKFPHDTQVLGTSPNRTARNIHNNWGHHSGTIADDMNTNGRNETSSNWTGTDWTGLGLTD